MPRLRSISTATRLRVHRSPRKPWASAHSRSDARTWLCCAVESPRGCTHLGVPDWLLLTAEASRRAQGYAAVHGILGIREARHGDYRPGGGGGGGWVVWGAP